MQYSCGIELIVLDDVKRTIHYLFFRWDIKDFLEAHNKLLTNEMTCYLGFVLSDQVEAGWKD